MSSAYSIQLNQLAFEACHGVYPSEMTNPGTFLVDVSLELELAGRIQLLRDTVDYAPLYEAISRRMQKPTPLLETLAGELVDLLLASDDRITAVALKITKCQPPIPQFKGSVSVSLTRKK
jgi:dihydroneopterin aldolase